MEQKLDITKLSKADKILFLELMKSFVGDNAEGELWDYCGLCASATITCELLLGYWEVGRPFLRALGIKRPYGSGDPFWYECGYNGTAKRIALIDKAIKKLKAK